MLLSWAGKDRELPEARQRPDKLPLMRTINHVSICIGMTHLMTVMARMAFLVIVFGSARAQEHNPVQSAQCPYALELIGSIDEWEIPEYVRLLDLSEGQAAYLRTLYTTYGERVVEIERRFMPGMASVANEADQRIQSGHFDHTAAFLFAEFMQQQKQMAADLDRADRWLFEQLQQVLAELQIEHLERAKLLRNRVRSAAVTREVPGARTDLSQFVVSHFERQILPLEIDLLLAEYERHLTPLLVSLRREVEVHAVRLIEIEANRQFFPSGERIERGTDAARLRTQEAWAESDSIRLKASRIQKQIARLNRIYLKALDEALPADINAAVQHRYKLSIYPSVHPDKLDPSALFDMVIILVNEQTREALQTFWDQYRALHASLSEKMAEEVDDWRAEFARTVRFSRKEPYFSRMRRLREERWLADIKFVDQMRSVLPADVAAILDKDFAAFKKNANDVFEQAADDQYPPP